MALENFTTYTEVDTPGRVTVATNALTISAMQRNEDVYVYKDFGAGHFSGSNGFEHLVKTQVTAIINNSIGAIWMLANSVDDAQNTTDRLVVYWQKPSTNPLIIGVTNGTTTDSTTLVSAATDYWLTIELDPATGANGTLFVRVYSDSGRTTLVDTLSIALSAVVDRRYLYGCSSFNISNAFTVSYTVADLDVQEGSGTPPTLSSVTISRDGTQLETQWAETISTVNSNPTLSFSGGAVTASSPTGTGSTVIKWSLSRVVENGETGTMSLAANSVEDTDTTGNEAISNQAVTNNSERNTNAFPILDFDASAGVLNEAGLTPADGSTVGTWGDQSWNALTASQEAASDHPLLAEENDIFRIRGGVDDPMVTGEAVIGTATDFTLTVAFLAPYKPSTTATIISEGNTAATSPSRRLDLNTNGTISFILVDGAGTAVVPTLTSTTDVCDGQPHVVTIHMTSGTAVLRVDGTQEDSDSEGTHNLGSATFNQLMLWNRVTSGADQHSIVDLFRVVCYAPTVSNVNTHDSSIIADYADAVRSIQIVARAFGGGTFGADRRFVGTSDLTLLGWANELGHIGVTAFNNTTAAFTHHLVDTGKGLDRHNTCVPARCSDDNFLLFWSNHNSSSISKYKTTTPEDLSTFGSVSTITPGGAWGQIAYLHPVETAEGVNNHRIWLFGRNEPVPAWSYITSDDDGANWSTPTNFWEPTNLAGGGAHKIYGTIQRIGTKVHVFILNGGPLDTGGTVDLFHFYYDTSDGDWKNSAGNVLSLPVTELTATLVYDSSANGNRNPQFRFNPVEIGGTLYVGIGNLRTGFRGKWNGSAWVLDTVVDSGTNSTWPGYVAPSPNNANKVYVDRQVSGVAQLYEYVTADGGSSWTGTQLTSGQHMGSLPNNGLRTVDSGHASLEVAWINGFPLSGDDPYSGWLAAYPATVVSSNTAGPGFLSSSFRF